MTRVCSILFLTILLLSCKQDQEISNTQPPVTNTKQEEVISKTEFILVNQIDGQGNISLYEYPTKKLTKQYFTINSTFKEPIITAVNDGTNLYISTKGYYNDQGYYKSKLRKIDLTTGSQTKEMDSWIDPGGTQYLNSHNGNLVVSYARYDFKASKYRSYVKIYDGNLTLRDSITESDVLDMRAAKIAGNKLFTYVIVENVGSFIRVMDLSARVYVTSIEVPLVRQFVYINENQLLVFAYDNYFILDTQSFQKSQHRTSYLGDSQFAYSSSDNVLYSLVSNTQPSVIPYTLYKLSLTTGELQRLTNGESIVGPIRYDSKTNVILSGGGLKVFSTQGMLLETVDLPYITSEILIK